MKHDYKTLLSTQFQVEAIDMTDEEMEELYLELVDAEAIHDRQVNLEVEEELMEHKTISF